MFGGGGGGGGRYFIDSQKKQTFSHLKMVQSNRLPDVNLRQNIMNAIERPELGSVDLKKYCKVLKKITVE